jgi:transposase-like protein
VTVLDTAPPCPWCGLSSVTELESATSGSRRYMCGSCRRVFVIHLEPLEIEPIEPLRDQPAKDRK